MQQILYSDEFIYQYLIMFFMQDNKEYKLILSVKRGIVEDVKILLAEGVNPNAVDEVDYTVYIK